MEKLMVQPALQHVAATDHAMVQPSPTSTPTTTSTSSPTIDWRHSLPTLAAGRVTLRPLSREDAPALVSMLTTDEVTRFIADPPTSIEGFERFVDWAESERAAGRYACFAVVPHGLTSAIGIFQLRQLEPGFQTAEWGFALGSSFWGAGFFLEAARMLVDFAVDTVGVHRLEARAAAVNGRGNAALRKIGAVQEGVLRRAFRKEGRQLDETLWSILADEWRQNKVVARPVFLH